MEDSKNKHSPAGKLKILPIVAVSIEFGDVQMVLDGLEDSDEVFRFVSAQMLARTFRKHKITTALKPLIKALDDSESVVR